MQELTHNYFYLFQAYGKLKQNNNSKISKNSKSIVPKEASEVERKEMNWENLLRTDDAGKSLKKVCQVFSTFQGTSATL